MELFHALADDMASIGVSSSREFDYGEKAVRKAVMKVDRLMKPRN